MCVCVCVAKPVAVELRCHATALISKVNNSAQPALGYGVRNPHTWTPGIIIRTNRV